jgi:hypothetical protein
MRPSRILDGRMRQPRSLSIRPKPIALIQTNAKARLGVLSQVFAGSTIPSTVFIILKILYGGGVALGQMD